MRHWVHHPRKGPSAVQLQIVLLILGVMTVGILLTYFAANSLAR